MNEIKELFDMVTEQKEPDQDVWKEQEDRQRRSVRNRRIGAFVGAAAVLAAVVIAIALLGERDSSAPAGPSPSDDQRTAVVTHYYVDVATGTRTPVVANLSGARLAEVSPDGRAIAWNSCCGFDALNVTQLDGSSDVEQITPEKLDGYDPTWIDDDTILFQGRESGTAKLGDLYVADVSTGKVNMVTDLPQDSRGAWIVASDVSPDGTTVLFHLPRGTSGHEKWDLWTVPLAGGTPSLLRKNAGFASYAPDGSIVYLDHPFDFVSKQISVMDADGTNARPLVKGGTFSWPSVSPDGTMVAYGNDGMTEVVNIGSGHVARLDVLGESPAWDGNNTLIVDDEDHSI